jgi:hypothetical protein
MATRKEEKERLRQVRLARQQDEQRSARTRQLGAYALAGLLSAAVLAGIVVMVAGGSGGSSSAGAGGPFGQHYDGLQDRETAANVPTMMDTMGSPSHFHPHLAVYVNGKQIQVPADIGIDPSQPSMSMAGLHTHDSSGTIHDEGMPGSRLGQFFEVWGVPFSKRQLGPHQAGGSKAIRMWVDGKPSKAFGNLSLEDGQQIVVVYGTPGQNPKGVPG